MNKKMKIGGSIAGALLVLGAIGQMDEGGTNKSEVNKPAITSEATNHSSEQDMVAIEITISPTLSIVVQLTDTPIPTEVMEATKVPTEEPTPTLTATPEPTNTPIPTATYTPTPVKSTETVGESTTEKKEKQYILNISHKKIHKPSCHSVDTMKEENKKEFTGIIDELYSQGYTGCKNCNPY